MADEQIKIIASVEVQGAEQLTQAQQDAGKLKEALTDTGNVPLDKPFKSLRAQIREATQYAAQMGEQFGRNSTQFNEAAQKVANLKDEFEKVNRTIAAFNPDNKLAALTGVARGAAGALEGVYGAMSFIGIEGAKSEETLKKLTALMAFTDALDRVELIKDSFKNFGKVVESLTIFQKGNALATSLTAGAMRLLGLSTETTGTAFKGLKAAIVGTGIGLLIVGIGELVSHWDDLKQSLGFASEAQEAYRDAAVEANKAATEAVAKEIEALNSVKAAFDEAKSGVISKDEALKKYNDTLGDAFGKTNDLATAEKNLNDKAGDYIKMTILKAQATEFFKKSAEAAAKGVTADLEDQTTFIDKSLVVIKDFFWQTDAATKGFNDAQKTGVEKVKQQAAETSKVLEDQGKKFLEQADEIGKHSSIQSKEQADLRKQELNDRVQHYQDLIKVAQAQGRDTYDLEIQMWHAKLATAVQGTAEYKSIYADMTAFILNHQKQVAEGLKEENEKQKQFLDSIEQQISASEKNQLDAKQNARQKELADIEVAYGQQKLTLQKQVDDRIKDAETEYKAHKISLDKFNHDKNEVLEKQSELETELTKEKEEKKLEVEKKYNKDIADFIDSFTENQYQLQRKKLIEDFDEKIKVADEKQKILLEKLKTQEVNNLDTKHNAEVNVTKTETNVIKTTRENTPVEGDEAAIAKAKVEHIAQAELDAENAAYELKKLNAKNNNDELEQIEQQHQTNLVNIQKDAANKKLAIDQAEVKLKQQTEQLKIQAIQAGLGIVEQLAGRNKKLAEAAFLLNKALAVGEIVMSTEKEIAGYWEAAASPAVAVGGPAAIAAAQAFAATESVQAKIRAGISIATIAAQSLTSLIAKNGGGGSGATGSSAPSIGTAPVINSTVLNNANQIQDVRVINQNKDPQRTYIVSSDLQTEQEKKQFMNKLGSFG